MKQFLHAGKANVNFILKTLKFLVAISSFLVGGYLPAGAGFNDVFLIKNDSDQIVQMNLKQGEAQLQVWMDKHESRRIACRLFGDSNIGPVDFFAAFPNWKDGTLTTTLKEDTDIDTENAETDEGLVYCIQITPKGEIKHNPDCNTSLYREGPRKLKFTLHVDNQFDEPVWVNVLEEKIGFKMCVPAHSESSSTGERSSEAAIETSRTMNLNNIVVDTDKLPSPAKLNMSSIYNDKQNENTFSDEQPVLGMDTLYFYLPLKQTKERSGILSDQPYLKVTVIKSDIRNQDTPSGMTPITGYEYNLIFELATLQDKADAERGGLLPEK